MGHELDVAVIGAGPYGLSVAAHLAGRMGVRVFGRPMEIWHARMPPKMLLRSAWEETSLSAANDRGTIDEWAAEVGEPRHEPIERETFLRYADWFRERFVPEIHPADVVAVEPRDHGFLLRTEDGAEVVAGKLVLAVGVTPFAYAPPAFAEAMGRGRVRFSIDRLDFTSDRGREVVVVGGGQGALESAALAAGAGARVELIARSRLHWFADREPGNPRSALAQRLYRLAYPAVGYGPPLLNRLALAPEVLASLPPRARHRITKRALRAGGSPWVRDVAEGRIRITERTSVVRLEAHDELVRVFLSDGTTREAAEVVVSAGYRFSLDRLAFLAPELRARIGLEGEWPALARTFESTVTGLFFVGYAAEGRFGPLMRFVLGTRFAARRVASALGVPERPRILVAGDDHYAVLAGLRALRSAGFEPWLVTSRTATYATRSRAAERVLAVPRPSATSYAFADAVAAAAVEVGASAVIPGSEETLVALSRARDRFPACVPVGVPAPEAVERANDKVCLEELAREAGLRTPPTREIGSADLNGAEPVIAFPIVVKPLRTKTATAGGFLHGRVRRADGHADLVRITAGLPGDRWLVQPFLRGSLAAVCGVAWDGEIVCAVHQVALRIAPADVGISAYAITIPRDPELEAAVGRLLGSLRWSGLFQAQFIRTDDGDYLIDFNPRMYGSLALAVAAGANLPAIWVDLLLGRPVHVADYRVGVRFRAEEKDVRAIARTLASGRVLEAVHAMLPHRHTAHAAFSLRDPLPLLSSIAKIRALKSG